MRISEVNHLKEENLKGLVKDEYTGSHGLRWNFAQNRINELQINGINYDQARYIVSNELGHHRPDITEHYLK